jgi:hypothetical protein
VMPSPPNPLQAPPPASKGPANVGEYDPATIVSLTPSRYLT